MVPKEKLEFYPLGGFVRNKEEREKIGAQIREKENISKDGIIFCHSGRMCGEKRTEDIIDAFSAVHDTRFVLLIIGVIMDDVKEQVMPKIQKDSRIKYLGWKNGDELNDYLCATDCYVQPGGQSATMQNAICCGCAVMLYPFRSHEPFLKGNGYYVSSVEDMKNAFENISKDPSILAQMRDNSYVIAHELLDYEKLAERICKAVPQGEKG